MLKNLDFVHKNLASSKFKNLVQVLTIGKLDVRHTEIHHNEYRLKIDVWLALNKGWLGTIVVKA